jgi:multicomponent Na+:H+ antiporter subunit G
MMDLVLDVLSWICLLGGAIFLLIGAIGVLRLSLVTVKLLLMFYFMIFTGPTAVHALAEAALQGKLKPVVDDREP